MKTEIEYYDQLLAKFKRNEVIGLLNMANRAGNYARNQFFNSQTKSAYRYWLELAKEKRLKAI